MTNESIKHYVGEELEAYTPPRHTLTSNLRLLPGDDANGEVSVVRGTIEHGGSALPTDISRAPNSSTSSRAAAQSNSAQKPSS